MTQVNVRERREYVIAPRWLTGRPFARRAVRSFFAHA